MFRVNNKNTDANDIVLVFILQTYFTYFAPFSSFPVDEFEQVNVWKVTISNLPIAKFP